MSKKSKTSCTAELNNLLQNKNKEGGFPISVITDSQGLSIAAATVNGDDPDRQSAVVALIRKAAGQVTRQMGWGTTDEIALYQADGQRLVCRPFQAGDQDLILAVMVTNRQQSYRRITNTGITRIKHIWARIWE